MDYERPQQTSGAEPGSSMPNAAPSIDSLATLLTQGLRSQNSVIIDRCLSTANEMSVKQTVARLESADAALLLEVVTTKMRAKVNRGKELALWIKAVLLRHTAYLMASPGQQQLLSTLQQTIESRLAVQEPIALLSGRLDLLLAQTRAHAEVPDKTPAATEQGPVPMEDSSEKESSEDDESSEEDE